MPGTTTTVTVYQKSRPAAGVRVFFNGEFVGRTDENGAVRARVPYTRELQVSVRSGGESPPDLGSTTRYFSLVPLTGGTVNTSVVTDLSLHVDGEKNPGGTAVVRVTVEETPVPGAVVFVDGERAGRTDERGRLSVEFPVSSTATIRATRGDLSANERVVLADVETSLRGTFPLGIALPGASATISVTDAGEPVEGATLTVAGRSLGRTGPDGTVTTTLPMQPTFRLGVETKAGLVVHAEKRIWIVPGVVIALMLAVGGVGLTYVRSSTPDRGFLEHVRRLLGGAAGRLLSVLVGVTVGFETRATRVWERLASAVRGRHLRPPTFTDLRRRIHEGMLALRDRTVARIGLWFGRQRTRFRRVSSTEDDDEEAPTTLTSRERIEAAWRRLLDILSLRRVRTMTPGEVAERAVAAGLPREPVEQLTDAFRSVVYSSADPAQHVEEAERATTALTDAVEDDA